MTHKINSPSRFRCTCRNLTRGALAWRSAQRITLDVAGSAGELLGLGQPADDWAFILGDQPGNFYSKIASDPITPGPLG